MSASLLVVDDEALNREIIAEYLEGEGFVLTMAQDGEQALQLLDGGREFDAVLLDRMMPGMDGIEVLRRMQREPKLAAMPVILQTAAAGHEQVAEGLRLGAYYYLTKPYHRATLVAVVRAALSLVEQRRRLARHIDDYRGVMELIDEGVFRLRSLDEARALAGALASLCADPNTAGFGLLELLANAVEHGNLGIGFEDKAALLAAGRWEEEVAARLAAPENAGKFVEVRCARERARLSVSIRDQGKGFDWRRYLAMDQTRAYRPNGRGIALAREVAFDSIQYAAQGSQVEVTLTTGEVASRPAARFDGEGRQLELDAATDLLASIVQSREGPRDPALTWAVAPTHRLSGDAVAAARTPSGRLVAMLVDASGHGLPAAISLLPVVQVFYDALHRDLSVPALSAELNCRLREYAVPGLFLAAVVVSVDYPSGRVEVWNGGMPGGLWLCEGRALTSEALASRHLPLGVLPADQFDSACAELDANRGHLLFCSDGLIEAAGLGGEPFGVERLQQHLRHPDAAAAVRDALDALAVHRAGRPAHDDMSWMMIALDPVHGLTE